MISVLKDEYYFLQKPFFIGDIIRLAGGNFTKLAVKGGVIGVDVIWNCDLVRTSTFIRKSYD